jgi:hypothetical protein
MRPAIILISLFLFFQSITSAQQDTIILPAAPVQKNIDINGFIRGGLYCSTGNENKNLPAVSTVFSDFALKINAGNGLNYKALIDLRYRYGSEFSESVSNLDLREGYINIYGKKWDFSAGPKIIKWGRADFTNPTSRLNPQNYISRSPDREDMDMGNISGQVRWSPSEFVRLEAVALPFYRPSVLLIDPIPLPDYVSFRQRTGIYSDQKLFSYGIRSDFHFRGIDFGLSWFDGYNPDPGIALTAFSMDMTGQVPVINMGLSTKPYRLRMAGMDFELAAGNLGIRGEAAYTAPLLSWSANEYIPYPELKWVAGMDWSSGTWHFNLEYSGKYVFNYVSSGIAPLIGTEPDYARLAQLMQMPGFDMHDYVKQQVASFNRLYDYQAERIYHSAGIKIGSDLLYGKISPSLCTLYNITSHDLLMIPELKFKPADGLSISMGAEIYNGRKGSLYDIVDGFMNSVYLSLRVDF